MGTSGITTLSAVLRGVFVGSLTADEQVLNGQKWWSSGAGDHRCKIYIVMGKSNPNHPDKYKQQVSPSVPRRPWQLTDP
jgi:alkylation response protein AidB-like acyl-CoA dehydrogenase